MSNIKAAVAAYKAAQSTAQKEREEDFLWGSFTIKITGVRAESAQFVDHRTNKLVDAKTKVIFSHREIGNDVLGTFYATNCPQLRAKLIGSEIKLLNKEGKLVKPFTHKVMVRVLKPELASTTKYSKTPRVVLYSEGDASTERIISGAELFGTDEIEVNTTSVVYINKPKEDDLNLAIGNKLRAMMHQFDQ